MAINDISLTSGMRSNLISLQGTVDLLNRTQERLSTGKKVNTALDNPLNFFTAKSLNSRAADLAGFKDGMSEAVQTIKAANNGISAIEGLLAQAKAVAATAKAGVAGGSGDYSNFGVDLVSVSAGQTIAVNNVTFTAVGTDMQKTINFAGLTGGNTITLGGTQWVATTASVIAASLSLYEFSIAGTSIVDAANFIAKVFATTGQTVGTASGSTVVVSLAYSSDAVTDSFSALQKTINFTGITYGDTITVGSIIYTASSADGTLNVGTTAWNFTVTGNAAADALKFQTFSTAQTAGWLGDVDGSGNFRISLAANTGMLTVANVAKSGTGITLNSLASVSTATISLYNTEFLTGATDDKTASNLAAKINTVGDFSALASTNHINITAISGGATLGSASVTEVSTAAGFNGFTIAGYQATSDRSSYAGQFNTIMDQLDLLATDSKYKGINFLAGDSLDVEFGTDPTDRMTLTGFSASATALLAKDDNSKTARNTWATNIDIDVDITALANATDKLKTEASRMSSGLSIINTRQDWVKLMVNTVTEGADKLTLADMNEEGANMLMLQTRQTLGTTALSLSAQAAQSVLRLFA